MLEVYDTAFGIGNETLTWWQMSLRAIVVFLAALVIIRIGNPRIFGKQTAFDIVLGIIYGSILSRAITGNAPFLPTIIAALVLVVMHSSLAAVAYRSNFGFGNFIKGEPIVLVKEGELIHKSLKRHGVTKQDLLEALRKSGTKGDLDKIETAYLERSGEISILPKKDNQR